MRKTLLFICLLLATAGGFMSYAKHNMVVPGRTWWYIGSEKIQGEHRWKDTPVGFKISEPLPADPAWHAVIAVDSFKNDVMDTPLCWLKEEDEKVWVRINFNIADTESGASSDERMVISNFLPWWHGDEINPELVNMRYPGCSGLWNPSKRDEYLLYDFSYKEREVCKWPWSGYQLVLSSPDQDPISDIAGPMTITGISEETTNTVFKGEPTKLYFLTQPTISGVQPGHMKIMERIGVIDGSMDSYVPELISWYGFFFAPQSLSNVLACNEITYYEPELRCVEDADGSLIYGKPLSGDAFVSSLGSDKKNPSQETYDLHGRVVMNPQPGSVYIRGGKKFVAR